MFPSISRTFTQSASRRRGITNRAAHHLCAAARVWRRVLILSVFIVLPALAAAQAPWERAASNLEQTFTGPLARSFSLVAIVVCGLMWMYGEGGARRQIAGVIFGGGLVLFAGQFLAWLF